MRMFGSVSVAAVLCVAIVAGPGAASAQDADLDTRIAAAVADLESGFPAEDAPAYRALLADPSSGVTAPMLGQLMYLRRHFDKAAWFFGEDALSDLSDAPSLNNFSASPLEHGPIGRVRVRPDVVL